MLSDFELLHRENLFIRLKNQGKNLDEIAVLLDVEKELVEKWNEEFEHILVEENKSKNDLIKRIERKDKHGVYYFQNANVVPNLTLEYILKDLNKLLDLIPSVTTKTPEHLLWLSLKDKAIEAINILKRYTPQIEGFFKKENEEEAIKYSYTQKNASEDIAQISKLINTALETWTFYCYTTNILTNVIVDTHSFDSTSSQKYYLALPYAVKQLKIINYHHINSLHIDNLSIDAQWIFLFGENAAGKTSILQAISLSLLPNLQHIRFVEVFLSTKIGIEFINCYINQINNLHNNHKPVENLVCYGSSRLNMGGENTTEEESKKSSLMYSLFHTDGMLLNIEKYLREWFNKKNPRFEYVVEAFKIIIPYLADIKVVAKNTIEDEVHYFEKIIDETGEATGDTQKVPFDHLAAGLKSVLAMVGDMFIRLYRTQPTVENPSELVGIAIIDELELHLHPKWQMKLPQLLSTVFPKVQFIASTHSAIPLLGATPNAIFIKVTRDKVKGIQAEKVNIDINNLTPNQLLYFLFDMEKITSVNNTDLSAVRTETTKEDFLRNDEVQRQLKALENTTDFPDDLFN